MIEEASQINEEGVNYSTNGAGKIGQVYEGKEINLDLPIKLNIKIKSRLIKTPPKKEIEMEENENELLPSPW